MQLRRAREEEGGVVVGGDMSAVVVMCYCYGYVTVVEAAVAVVVLETRYTPDAASWALALYLPSLRPARAT